MTLTDGTVLLNWTASDLEDAIAMVEPRTSAFAERRLAAILAADVVEYSRLMSSDEEGTLARLQSLRADFIDPTISAHRGRIVKLMGDGTLVEFTSVVDALRCAVELQRGIAKRSSDLPEEQRIRLRIGINLGDVIIEDDDIYGDGVNVASRLEGLAEPGGIVISGTVFDHAKRAETGFRYIGEQKVKNIPEPVRSYRVLLDPDLAGKVIEDKRPFVRLGRWWLGIAALAMVAAILGWLRPWEYVEPVAPDVADIQRFRVAVLPFANISTDSADEFFSDGLTEELISQLSKVGKLTVIARTSVMKYKESDQDIAEIGRGLGVGTILEGSVRRAEDQLRITAKLINVTSQALLWSEEYDRPLKDVFAIQSDISKQVVEALQITLLPGEWSQIEHRQTTNIDAHRAYVKGIYFFNLGGVSMEKGRSYLEQAIQLDPGYALAYARLARLFIEMPWHTNMPAEEAYSKAREAAEKALALDDTLAEAHAALASVKVNADWDWPGAEREFKKAITLDPNYALAFSEYGQRVLSATGRWDEAIAEMERARDLDPLSVLIAENTGWVYWHARRWEESIARFRSAEELSTTSPWPKIGQGFNYLMMGRYDDAIAALDAAAAVAGNFHWLTGVRGAALGLAGRTDEARKILRDLQDAAASESVSPMPFAYVYMGLGDHGEAIRWLRRAYEQHSASMLFLRAAPFWDSLRSEPDFVALVQEVGLPVD